MPELPEVETLNRQLQEIITGKCITDVKVLDEKLGGLDDLAGQGICAPYREGKRLHIPLDNGEVILLHLRMTGRLLWQENHAPRLPHTRLTIGFAHGRLDLIDPRRFATVKVQQDGGNHDAGPLPGDRLSPALLAAEAGRRSLPVKSFLMDQRFIAGIGNIYACEILYDAGINPQRRTKEVSLADWRRLCRSAKTVLTEAVACRGTSVSDWYDLYGKAGEYQHRLKVYGKEGVPCPRCGTAIMRFKLGGRGTYVCPSCQT